MAPRWPTAWRRSSSPSGAFSRDWRSRRADSSVDQLDRHRGRFAAADAEGGEAALAAGGLERRDERAQDSGAAGADRVAQSGGAAVDVELFVRDVEVAHRDHCDAGEGLVDLEQVDVV